MNGFEWRREPAGEWQRQLAQLAPETQALSWLKLYWVAGTPRQPVQRWVVFQMTPRSKIPTFVLDLLTQTSRDEAGRLDLMREQWELFHATGCYAQPFWIIQGTKGGHKRRFNHIEQSLCKLYGKPTSPPVAGSLPYADFDRRVVEKLAPLDRVRFWEYGSAFAERSPEQMDAEMQDAIRVLRSELWDWLETQVDEAFDSVSTVQRPVAVPTSPDAPYVDRDEARADILSRDV